MKYGTIVTWTTGRCIYASSPRLQIQKDLVYSRLDSSFLFLFTENTLFCYRFKSTKLMAFDDWLLTRICRCVSRSKDFILSRVYYLLTIFKYIFIQFFVFRCVWLSRWICKDVGMVSRSSSTKCSPSRGVC